MVRVGEHGNQQVEEEHEVDQDEDDQIGLSSVLVELTKILLSSEGTKQLDEQVPHVEIVRSEVLGVEHTNNEDGHDRKGEGSYEFDQIDPECHHHNDCWTDQVRSTKHTQNIEAVLGDN